MDEFQITLTITIVLCGLVSGLVFTFGIIVMPGIKSLPDRDYLHTFAVMDRIIQNNQPFFMLTWVGSILSLIVLCYLGIVASDQGDQLLLGAATVIYLLGVQLPTFVFNIPLNNRLQQLSLDQVNDEEVQHLKNAFATRWVISNHFRTVMSLVVMVLLIMQAIQL